MSKNTKPILAILSALFYMTVIYILKTVLPYIAFSVGASGVLVARILYLSFIMFAFLPPFVGYLSDLFGSKRIILFSSIIEAILILAYISARTYTELFIIRFFQAIFGVMLSASFLHLASAYAKESGVYIGFLRFAQALGMAMGSLIVFLVELPIDSFVMIAAILCLVPILVAILDEKANARADSYKIDYFGTIKLVVRKDLLFYYLCSLANILSASIVFSFVVVHMIEKFELDMASYAFIMLFLTTTFGISPIIAGKLCDRSSRLSGLIGVVGILISLTLMLTSKTLIQLVLSLILFEVLSAFAYNPLYVVLSRRLPDSIRGSGINLADTLLNKIFLLLPILEFIAESYGLASTLILPIISILAIISLPATKPYDY